MPDPEREQRATLNAYRSFSEVTEVGGAVVVQVPAAADSPMLNRIVGLGVDRPATQADVDAALGAIAAGTTFYVAVAPQAQPPELTDWLPTRGLEPGWGWMVFRRGVQELRPAPTELRPSRVRTPEQAADFARIVRAGYELPEATEAVLAATMHHGWECWLAVAGDTPAGAAALYVDAGVGYLGLAATAPEHRGRGAQSALLAARIARAAELGCDTLITETGERRDGRPDNSYRNILRAGFEEVAVTANWLGRA